MKIEFIVKLDQLQFNTLLCFLSSLRSPGDPVRLQTATETLKTVADQLEDEVGGSAK